MLYLLRLLLLAVHFIAVGIIGLLIGLSRPFHVDNTRRFARLYGLATRYILGIEVQAEVDALHTQAPGYVIVANHQSNLDLFLMGRQIAPRTVSMGKKSLKWLPLFGQLFWLGGNVLIDRSNAYKAQRALAATTRALSEQQTTIWVFPEGTRNRRRHLQAFKKGAFQMAIDAGVPIIPVCISRYAGTLRLNRWRSGEVRIKALPAIDTRGLTRKDVRGLAEDCQRRMQACIDGLQRPPRGHSAEPGRMPRPD